MGWVVVKETGRKYPRLVQTPTGGHSTKKEAIEHYKRTGKVDVRIRSRLGSKGKRRKEEEKQKVSTSTTTQEQRTVYVDEAGQPVSIAPEYATEKFKTKEGRAITPYEAFYYKTYGQPKTTREGVVYEVYEKIPGQREQRKVPIGRIEEAPKPSVLQRIKQKLETTQLRERGTFKEIAAGMGLTAIRFGENVAQMATAPFVLGYRGIRRGIDYLTNLRDWKRLAKEDWQKFKSIPQELKWQLQVLRQEYKTHPEYAMADVLAYTWGPKIISKGTTALYRTGRNIWVASTRTRIPAEKILSKQVTEHGKTFPTAPTPQARLSKLKEVKVSQSILRDVIPEEYSDYYVTTHATHERISKFGKKFIVKPGPAGALNLEDAGLYVSGGKEASPYFFKIGTPTEYRFTLNLFKQYKPQTSPSLLVVLGKDIKTPPKVFLKMKGYKELNKWYRQVGSKLEDLFQTKRSIIGETPEIEAVAPAQRVLQKVSKKGVYIRYKGWNIPVDVYAPAGSSKDVSQILKNIKVVDLSKYSSEGGSSAVYVNPLTYAYSLKRTSYQPTSYKPSSAYKPSTYKVSSVIVYRPSYQQSSASVTSYVKKMISSSSSKVSDKSILRVIRPLRYYSPKRSVVSRKSIISRREISRITKISEPVRSVKSSKSLISRISRRLSLKRYYSHSLTKQKLLETFKIKQVLKLKPKEERKSKRSVKWLKRNPWEKYLPKLEF